MYPLQKKTRSIIKKSFKYAAGVNPFDWEELQEEKNKKHKPFKSYVGYKDGNAIRYQCNQNLWFEVWKELKPHMPYKQWLKENGLSITPQTQVYGVEHSYWMFEEVHSLTVALIDIIADQYFELLSKKAYDKNVDLFYQYLNAMEDKLSNIVISNEFGAYEVSTLCCYIVEFKHQKFLAKIKQTELQYWIKRYINDVEDILNNNAKRLML